MTWPEFKKKWGRSEAKETASYQEHFTDLCRLLGQPTPIEADPSGSDFFCYQKRVVKDAELFALHDSGEEAAAEERGFADVWKKGCFAWEYKGKKKNLDEAYKQLLRYRESLLNPPLLIVCDFERYVIRTNFNGTVQETHEFTNDHIDDPKNLALLRAIFTDPEFLKPQRTTAQVTEALAETIAEVAKSLQKRESEELADARTRSEMNFAQRKYLRIARFLNRIVFCFFAEDTGLLPKNLFTELLKTGLDDLHHFAETLEKLFRVMAKGGTFGVHKIRHFNGHLFNDSTVFELTEDELRKLADAGEADWQFIQPGIMGTLFERALDFEEGGKLRAQLGAHYTSEADIKTLVEPVLMAPLRRDWAALKAELAPLLVGTPRRGVRDDERTDRRSVPTRDEARDKLAAFQKKLAAVSVLDPACGSGNFLYVSLQLLLDLEKEVVTYATQLGFRLAPQVSVQQLRAIEINPYAFELAQVSVQIGFLQWRRDNGFDNDRSPVLQNLDGFQNEDALLVPHFRSKAKTLKEAQAGEHAGDDALKFYTEREWPKCDVIVGNPPFLGNKRLRSELGDAYTKAIFDTYGDRLPATSDFCCYWFEKARDLIVHGKCRRAGLLGTTGSKQISSRRAFERIRETGKIIFAISDRDWFDAGTAIRICMVGFAGREATDKPMLDGVEVLDIHPDLTSGLDTTGKRYLSANTTLCFMGTTKVGEFDMPAEKAVAILSAASAEGLPDSDVIRPFRNGSDLVRENSDRWIVDFGVGCSKEAAGRYRLPFQHVVENVKEEREKNNDPWRRKHWWLLGRTLPDFREATASLSRYIGTARVAKHRLFVWQDSVVLPDSKVIAIAFDDDYRFGILHSRIHGVWTEATQALHGGERPTYNPTECFETFPFPFRDDLQRSASGSSPAEPEALEMNGGMSRMVVRRFLKVREEPPSYRTSAVDYRAAIAAAARELNTYRENWLNPPEWTTTEILEFRGTVGGIWDRYIAPETIEEIELPGQDDVPPKERKKIKVGQVRYPRLAPKDANCAAQLKKRTLTNLYNERPAWLDIAHKKLDAAVAAAYGWPADLTDEQILEKLLALNLERAAEEAKAAKLKKPKAQRAKHTEEMI